MRNRVVSRQHMNYLKLEVNNLYVPIHSPFTSADFKTLLVTQRQEKQKATPATDDPHVYRK